MGSWASNICQVTKSVWGATLGLAVDRAETPSPPSGEGLIFGCVKIGGA